jgi:Ca-activated chloride channel family protein
VQSLLSELQPRMAGPRTMIGDAIGLAVRLFESSDKQNKVAILLTDGNDTGSQMPVAKAAQIAANNGIVIHTIAMGNPQTAGEQALDLPLLQTISAATGGEFFIALNRSELDVIYAELDRIEPELLDSLSYRPTVEFFYVPLALLLLLNLIFVVVLLLVRSAGSSDHTALSNPLS